MSNNLYELMVSLGSTNPRANVREYTENGVTKFRDRQLNVVHVRNIDGTPTVTYPKLTRG